MSILIYSMGTDPASLPHDEGNNARTTVTAVIPDADSSVMADAPEFNEIQVDGITEGGLTPAQMASSVIPSLPAPPMAGENDVNDAIQTRVNDGISTLGYSPAIEASGRWGHGTMKIVEGIEPAISAAPFDNTYFAVEHHKMESTPYMTPSVTDSSANVAGQIASNNSGDASSPYDALKNWE